MTRCPGVAVLLDGGFLILGKVADGKLLVPWPMVPQPETMTGAELHAIRTATSS